MPEEFYDITSQKLLKQPEPQYLYALLMKRALGLSLSQADFEEGGLPLPGHEIPEVGSSYATAEEQRRELSNDIIAANAIEFVTELGKSPGHTVRLTRPKFQDTTYTQASRRILPNQTISTTPAKVQSEQVSITLDRFGGPYDADQSAVAPIAIDQMDASLPVHKLVSVRGMQLVRDFDKTLDKFTTALFDLAANVIYPKGATADTDMKAVDSHPFDWDSCRRAERKLDELNIPVFPDGKRIMVLTPKMWSDLGADPEYQRQTKYDLRSSGLNPVYNASFCASVGSWHVFRSTTLDTTANGTTSVPVHHGHAFGPGMVGAGMGGMPEARHSTSTNYGTQSLVVWLWLAGFACIDNRFGLSLRAS
jgi:hypothetical protein